MCPGLEWPGAHTVGVCVSLKRCLIEGDEFGVDGVIDRVGYVKLLAATSAPGEVR
jgi:hypothetical protein